MNHPRDENVVKPFALDSETAGESDAHSEMAL
jgi:hypothetical protein